MSPELERLLNALWERDTAEPHERARWKSTVDLAIGNAVSPNSAQEDLAKRRRSFGR